MAVQGGGVPGAGGAKRLWRNYLLDRMQLRYTAVIVVLCAALTAGLGHLVMKHAYEASDTIRLSVVAEMGPEAADIVVKDLAKKDLKQLYGIIAFGVLLCSMLTAYGIIITHKVAGPLYKMQTYFTAIREGRLTPVRALRKGDQLQEFFEQFSVMHDSLRKRTQKEIDVLADVVTRLEATGPQGELAQTLQLLKDLKQAKEKSLLD